MEESSRVSRSPISVDENTPVGTYDVDIEIVYDGDVLDSITVPVEVGTCLSTSTSDDNNVIVNNQGSAFSGSGTILGTGAPIVSQSNTGSTFNWDNFRGSTTYYVILAGIILILLVILLFALVALDSGSKKSSKKNKRRNSRVKR